MANDMEKMGENRNLKVMIESSPVVSIITTDVKE